MDEDATQAMNGDSFASATVDYVAAIEGAAGGRDMDRLGTARLLVGLIAAALDLPSVDVDEWDAVALEYRQPQTPWIETPDVTWPAEFPDLYVDVFDPLAVYDKKPATYASLADDLLDIYRDVKPPLIAWNAGNYLDAVWDWRYSFETHWHRHATSALRVLLIVGDGAERRGVETASVEAASPPNTAAVGGANTAGFVHGIGNLVKAAIEALRF